MHVLCCFMCYYSALAVLSDLWERDEAPTSVLHYCTWRREAKWALLRPIQQATYSGELRAARVCILAGRRLGSGKPCIHKLHLTILLLRHSKVWVEVTWCRVWLRKFVSCVAHVLQSACIGYCVHVCVVKETRCGGRYSIYCIWSLCVLVTWYSS